MKSRPTFAVLFMALVTVPALIAPFLRRDEVSEIEHRRLAEPPAVPTSIEELGTFGRRFDTWWADAFGLREQMTWAYSGLLFHGLGVAPFQHVDIREGGWIFASVPHSGACPQTSISDAQIAERAEALGETSDALVDAGITFVVLIVPPKETVYLPDAPQRACETERTNGARLAAAVRSRAPEAIVVDPHQALVEAKTRGRLYYLRDPHWNELGAHVGYTELIDAIGEHFSIGEPHAIEEFRRERRVHHSGAYSRFANLDLGEATDVYLVPRFALRARRLTPAPTSIDQDFRYEQQEIELIHRDESLPSVLVFRNSYFKQLKGLVPEHFSRTTVVWSELDLPRALREAPDIVIGQITF